MKARPREISGRPDLMCIAHKDLNKTIDAELRKALDRTVNDLDAMVLLILHKDFGFGFKRLKRFRTAYLAECEKLKEYYSLREEDEAWYAQKRLQEYGLSLESLTEEGS